jgi:topoisomerase-4 subunit A
MLEPRSSRLSQQEFMAVLLAHTSLEANVSLNMTMIGGNGRPQQKHLRQILLEWVAFRMATVERRTRHRLGEVDKRLHILDGRMIAFLRIEEVIRVIRESDEPKPELMRHFALSEIQAEDILEIRLRQLARLEGIRIEKELGELREERSRLQILLDDRKELTKLVVREIGDDAKQFGDERRTLIEAVAPTASAEVTVPDEPVTLILSKNGWVRTRQGHGLDANGITYKTGDTPWLVAETRTIWPLILLDDQGRAYSIRVSDLPGGRGDGVPITTLIELQDGGKLAHALTAAPEASYLFSGSGGYGFVAQVTDLISRNRAGKAFMALDQGEQPLQPARSLGDTVAIVSQKGRLLLFPLAELKALTKGRGLMLIDLDINDELVAAAINNGEAVTISGIGRGGKITEVTVNRKEVATYRGTRARKGHRIPSKFKPIGIR